MKPNYLVIVLVSILITASAMAADVQIDSFDNFAANGWSDDHETVGNHEQWVFQEVPIDGPHEGASCVRIKFENWSAPEPMDSTLNKIFTPTLDLSGADGSITFWYWPDIAGDGKVNQIILFDSSVNIARISIPKPTVASWQKVVIPLEDFVPDSGPLDLTDIWYIQFWFTCDPGGGNSIYIDDLRYDDNTVVPANSQINLPRVEQMPNIPFPYEMRDWKQVAIDYDNFVFDFTKTGDYLPLIWWDNSQVNFPRTMFGMPSYVGSFFQTGGTAHEGINTMGAVLGATLAGIDKSDQNGYNWVLMLENFYGLYDNENLYLNNLYGDTGGSFWIDALPSILFYQLADYYPGTGNFESQFVTTADRWYDACVAMGGRTSPWTVPNFNYTAFDFDTMTPVYNGAWYEADASATIGWVEYMAYLKLGDQKYLDAADWSMQYIQNQSQSPLYDVLLCYAPYIAARMNAEQGRNYDVEKFLNFCFTGNQYNWGIQANNWGGQDVSGLASNATYAFEMETLNFAGALSPVVRYDQRYARAIGKYMLNVANSVRLFYPGAHDAAHQTGYDWASTYDPDNCIGYEALKEMKWTWARTDSEQTNTGAVISADHLMTHKGFDGYEVLQERIIAGGSDGLEHIWHLPLDQPGNFHQIVIVSRIDEGGDDDNGFDYYYSTSSNGPWTYLFNVNSTTDIVRWTPMSGLGSDVYIKVQDNNRIGGNYNFDTLYVEDIYVHVEDNTTKPFASGDPLTSNWGNTDLGLYGSSYIGILGGIVSTTNVDKILQLDLLKTDYYRDAAYPTYLYFNPHASTQSVDINVGPDAVDLYDTVSQTFLATNVSGNTSFDIAGDSAVIVVLAPSGKEITIDANKKLIDNVIVDYRADLTFATCDEVIASPYRLVGDVDGNCSVDIDDVAVMVGEWLTIGVNADIVDDDNVDFVDFTQIGLQWLECNDPENFPPCIANW